jgi:spermidine/putrescine transport system ATP-binding protein
MGRRSALVLKGITKTFGKVTAVDSVSLEAKDGEFISLLGPSGCGKTTLLRIISGFEIPDAGELLLDGREILNVPVHKRPMNMVFQRYALFPHMTIYENIAFSQALKKRPKQEIQSRVKEMLKLVQLEGYEDRKPSQLSGGQSQRIALVRALINEPRVLLLDEPLGALDLKIRKQMQIELKNIQSKLGITFIYVTHDQEEALVMSDRIVLLNHGKVIQDDQPARIYHHPKSRFAATFIGESNILDGTVVGSRAGRLEVDCGGCLFSVKAVEGAQKGERVCLAVRLDKVKILRGGGAGSFDNVVSGKIEEVVFYGSIIKLYVSAGQGLRFLVEERMEDEQESDSIAEKNIGETVRLGFQARDTEVFREDPTATSP